MAVAVFNYAQWAARYPELAGSVDAGLAAIYFTEATLYLDNTDCSPVTDVATRLALLNMIVAHIAKLNATINGAAPSGLVGRISSATQGSVSVSVDGGTGSEAGAWFQQTTYGAAFWRATAPYRTMQYVAAPQPNMEPFYGPWGPMRWPL